ncbi:MAG: hypothetical protein IKE55_11920 [Kiritimatiellae bacterium]|nr:hypothetical protein [Kiritimatiellia bacterium]
MSPLAAILLLALSRAEIIARFKAPAVTQAEGMVRVYADCPEDMRREFQMPVARFAADTVRTLRRGHAIRSERAATPGIVISVGGVRTNDATVVARAVTNGQDVVTRIFVRAPGYADLERLRIEVVKGFYRRVRRVELSDEEAVAAYRSANPALRVADERRKLEEWLATGRGVDDDEEALGLMRRILQPGVAFPRDVLVFASRLYLYPPQHDLRFAGRFDRLSFREAIAVVAAEPAIRPIALAKASEVPVFGGGRGASMSAAADAYMRFLLELAKGTTDSAGLTRMLDEADTLLNVAFEEAVKREGDMQT